MTPPPDEHPVLVLGATGYIGRRLITELVSQGHHVRAVARTPGKLDAADWSGATGGEHGQTGGTVEVVRGDALDPESLALAFAGARAAYYLVHSIGGDGDWAARDRQAAANVRDAAAAAGLSQLIYLGGLGDAAGGELSPHLRSRHEVGQVLASGPVPCTELQAAVVIGSGSASFEMLRHLVEVLPVMVTPKWLATRCQPIAVRDVLGYLVGVLDEPEALGRVLEIGGPDVLTYRQMMDQFAEVAGLRRRLIVTVPVLSPSLSSLWVGLVTPLPADLARPLVDSLVNEVVVHDDAITRIVPRDLLSYRDAVDKALHKLLDLDVSTTWADAELGGRSPADPLPADPGWSGGTVLSDVQERDGEVDPDVLFSVLLGIGGERGWLRGEWLWRIRGAMDRLVGGVGLRRGRRHPDHLRVGDPLDFWRVEALEPGRLLRLRAEMRLPGEAWLEWTVTPTDDGAHLEQRALFHPRGLYGRAYWLAVTPFHRLVFAPMADQLMWIAGAGGHPPIGVGPGPGLDEQELKRAG